jgi:ribokinase
LAREAGVPVLLDPAPAPAAALEASLLESVSYLKPNESEAERLTGIRVIDEATAADAAQALVRGGVSTAIITLGSRGACWATLGGAGLVPGYAVRAMDSTAAGDGFSAALACELARGKPLAAAVQFANLVGALTATRPGAQPSLPTRDEVDRFAAAM